MALALVTASCTFPTDRKYLAEPGDARVRLTESTPGEGESGVVRNPTLSLTFDQRLDPSSISGTTVKLFSGPRLLLTGRAVDHIDCRLRVTPQSTLDGLLFHRLVVEGVLGVDGSSLPQPIALGFETGDATAPPVPDPVPETLTTMWPAVIQPRCASCHRGDEPPAGLDLASPASTAAGLIGRPSRFRPGRLLVEPGSHASSYLMHKLLALPGIFGDPMPPTGDWPSDRACGTADADLRRIARWIDAGALP